MVRVAAFLGLPLVFVEGNPCRDALGDKDAVAHFTYNDDYCNGICAGCGADCSGATEWDEQIACNMYMSDESVMCSLRRDDPDYQFTCPDSALSLKTTEHTAPTSVAEALKVAMDQVAALADKGSLAVDMVVGASGPTCKDFLYSDRDGAEPPCDSDSSCCDGFCNACTGPDGLCNLPSLNTTDKFACAFAAIAMAATSSCGDNWCVASPNMAPVQTLASSLQTDDHFCTKMLYTSAPAAMEMEDLDSYCYATCHACGLDCSHATESVQAKALCDLSFATPVPWQGGNVAGWCGIFHLQPNCYPAAGYNTTQVNHGPLLEAARGNAADILV